MAAETDDTHYRVDMAAKLVDFTDAIATAQDLPELAERVLPELAAMAGTGSALFYITDPRLITPRFFSYGIGPEDARDIESTCANTLRGDTEAPEFVAQVDQSVARTPLHITLCKLQERDVDVGLAGIGAQPEPSNIPLDLWERLVGLLAHGISRLAERAKSERQLAQLNTYLTVSSLLAQPLGLRDMMEAALYCSIDAVSAEAASVLMVDDDKKSFHFYQVEGPAKPVLMAATFPVGKGLAGDVFRTQESEIINDVQHDPRFYNRIDADSGFSTRNMIAIPLTAGEERIGVLEVLNKVDGGDFTEEERSLLLSIAEEIAFAIRNARIFEYVVGSYCKQRQGQLSCKGCERPLGSWTPCVRYRENAL